MMIAELEEFVEFAKSVELNKFIEFKEFKNSERNA